MSDSEPKDPEVLYSEPKYAFVSPPPLDPEWECYLWGSGPDHAYLYQPVEGQVPNRFVRWMMGICLGCKWVKK